MVRIVVSLLVCSPGFRLFSYCFFDLDICFFSSFRSYYIWIGLNDLGVEGNYKWSDGSPVAYTNHGWREPNDWNGQEDCIHLIKWNGQWNDNQCGRPYPYICKKHNSKLMNRQTDSKAGSVAKTEI